MSQKLVAEQGLESGPLIYRLVFLLLEASVVLKFKVHQSHWGACENTDAGHHPGTPIQQVCAGPGKLHF